MPWEFKNDKPIFQQLVDTITVEILTGRYPPGGKLDTVRDLAVEAGVNPNTMQRALQEIEATGLVVTRRGDGRYVSEEKAMLDNVRKEIVDKNVEELLSALSALGLSKEEILKSIQQKLLEQPNAS